MEKKEPLYLTTTIPYVNAAPHIGHALEFVQADAIVRFERLRRGSNRVYFLSGSDENASKNVQSAEKEGVSIQELVDRNSEAFRTLLSELSVSIDQFIRTTEPRHFKGAQALWEKTNAHDIYKKTYQGLYCVGCELFYRPEELTEHGECFEHPGRALETVAEENYFFKLSNYGPWLKKLIVSGELNIVPESRKNEVLAFIDQGLEDFSISRPVARSKQWGVPVPGDSNHTIYVWYDALANYITALGYPDETNDLYASFWGGSGERVHIMGKGVTRFHAVYWPAMLKSAGLPLPTRELVHGYITIEGQKISKTLGNVINPSEMVRKYGADAVRYYLLREISSTEDGDWSEKKFRTLYNADLANGLGNFAARVLTLAERETNIPRTDVDPRVTAAIADARSGFENKIGEFRINEAIASLWSAYAFGDGYVNEKKVWAISDAGERQKALYELVSVLSSTLDYLVCVLPHAAEILASAITTHPDGSVSTKKPAVLFPRIS